MFFTIYKITNILDGKFYIGKHQTKNLDDGYLGSGKLLGRAIKKYGKENFKKEILEIHDTEEAMNAAEARLVVLSKQSYNLCEGGHGGFGYVNSHEDKTEWVKRGYKKSNLSKYASANGKANKGSKRTAKQKENIRVSLLGSKPGNLGMKYKQKNHNSASHPKGPRGPYKKHALLANLVIAPV